MVLQRKSVMEGNRPGHEQNLTVRLGDGIEFTGTIRVPSEYDDPKEVCEQIQSAIRDTLISLSLSLEL